MKDEFSSLLRSAAERGSRYRSEVIDRRVSPSAEAVENLSTLDGPMPEAPSEPSAVLELLDEIGSPATVGMAGGRYFGFVIGSSLPASLAANWLAGAWDQNTCLTVMSPVGTRLESIALRWLLEIFGLPSDCGGSFVTGCTMANFTSLAAARNSIYTKAGWNVEAAGLIGAPDVQVIIGEEAHVTLIKALGLLGLGRERVVKVPVDNQGRMRADRMPRMDSPGIVCVQAGNVNSGAFDPIAEICDMAHESGSWVHVDGAFGLWATAAPTRSHLANGIEKADSWATDAHKWLNVPYDCGLAFVRDPKALFGAMSLEASYLPVEGVREPMHFTPEASRRARGVEVWAALRSLGRTGIADLVERTCRYASQFAEELASAGYEILNDVELNQVLVSFGSPEKTKSVIEGIQKDGTCWCGGTVWQGRTAMRISVSSWATTEDDVRQSIDAMIRVAAEVGGA
jgi:glutamate/tyrosine decarboxylase-like PLP-dependent enzyme